MAGALSLSTLVVNIIKEVVVPEVEQEGTCAARVVVEGVATGMIL